KPAAGDERHDLLKANGAAVAEIEGTSRDVAACQNGEADRAQQRPVFVVERAVDEDRPRPRRLATRRELVRVLRNGILECPFDLGIRET
ncbi:MAG TPA: hypothetical protein VGC36_15725, partial [Rhizomicrobium sp.]